MRDGITFDTGALIALERRSARARKLLERATELKVRVTVPSVVITEWWRGRSDVRDHIGLAVRIEPLSERLAKLAGEALASVRGSTAIDAIVMASAAQRGDLVYTSDVDDLQRPRRTLPRRARPRDRVKGDDFPSGRIRNGAHARPLGGLIAIANELHAQAV